MELKINGTLYDFFIGGSFTLAFDKIASSFSITAYFNPDNEAQKKLFKPLKGQVVELFHDGNYVFTGVILNNTFNKKASWQTVTVSGYSKTGVLEDSSIPTSSYPLESNGLSLVQIAQKLIKPFNISLIVDPLVSDQANKAFAKTTAKETDSVKSYLSKLANQRNLVLTHTPEGDLFITKADVDQKVSWVYDDDDDKINNISSSVNGQKIHSDITSIRQASVESDNAGQSKASNIYVSSTRPLVKNQGSGTNNDSSDAAINAVLSELKNIKFTIGYEGYIHNPNQIIQVKEPFVYLYEDTKLFIESVTVTQTKNSVNSVLSCVIPDVYSNKLPVKSIF